MISDHHCSFGNHPFFNFWRDLNIQKVEDFISLRWVLKIRIIIFIYLFLILLNLFILKESANLTRVYSSFREGEGKKKQVWIFCFGFFGFPPNIRGLLTFENSPKFWYFLCKDFFCWNFYTIVSEFFLIPGIYSVIFTIFNNFPFYWRNVHK